MHDSGSIFSDLPHELNVDIREAPYHDAAAEDDDAFESARCVYEEDEDDYGPEFAFDDDDEMDDELDDDFDEFEDDEADEEDDLDEDLDPDLD